MISFGMSEDQELVQNAMREFAAEAIRPLARECDESGEIPNDFLETAWTLGLTSTQIPEAHGGAGEDRSLVTHAILVAGPRRRLARDRGDRPLALRQRDPRPRDRRPEADLPPALLR